MFDNSVSQDKLLKFVVENNHTFSIVEETGFIDFVQSLNPNFVFVGATAMKNRIIKTYLQKKNEIWNLLKRKRNGKYSATTDLWTSPGQKYAMMGVTLTWVDAEFAIQELLLGFRRIKGVHSGTNIAQTFLAVLKEYGVESRVSVIINIPSPFRFTIKFPLLFIF